MIIKAGDWVWLTTTKQWDSGPYKVYFSTKYNCLCVCFINTDLNIKQEYAGILRPDMAKKYLEFAAPPIKSWYQE